MATGGKGSATAATAALAFIPQQMERGLDAFLPHDSLAIRQTRKGCLQSLFGCDANEEFVVTPTDDKGTQLMYVTEDTDFCIRLLCKNLRPYELTMTVPSGHKQHGMPVAHYKRPFRCPLQCLKCCCFQEVATTSQGQFVGAARETAWCCIPSFAVLDPNDNPQYLVHMPTCCGGICVNCCAEGSCLQVPFYIYEPDKDQPGQHVGKIVKIFRGIGTELFTEADTFMVEFPAGVTSETKANLAGMTFLLNTMFFEQQA